MSLQSSSCHTVNNEAKWAADPRGMPPTDSHILAMEQNTRVQS